MPSGSNAWWSGPASRSDTSRKEGLRLSQKEKKSPKSEAKEWLISIAWAVGIALVIHFFIFSFTRVDGPSMQPTLFTDERVLITKFDYWFGGMPDRGDIVIVRFPGQNGYYVKRVIGLPGDTLVIRNSTVYINGNPLSEDYVQCGPYEDMASMTVSEDCIFVMGDNRANSTDSRIVGELNRSQIVGKARLVVWPFDQFGALTHTDPLEE